MFSLCPSRSVSFGLRSLGEFRTLRQVSTAAFTGSSYLPKNGVLQNTPSFFVSSGVPISYHKTQNYTLKKRQSLGYRGFSTGGKDIIVKVPPMGDSITDGTLSKWHKNVGDEVSVDDLIASIETDKITQEIRTPETGVLSAQLAELENKVLVGQDLFKVTIGGQPSKSSKEEPKQAKEDSKPQKEEPITKEIPKKENPRNTEDTPKAKPEEGKVPNVPRSADEGKGKAPSAPKDEGKAPSAQPKSSEQPKSFEITSTSTKRTERREAMSRLRQRVSSRLKDSQNTYALLTTFQEADLTNLMELREEYKEEFLKKHNVKLGFMSAFVKATAAALTEIPVVNAVIDGDEIVYRDYVDISVAVATPKGLVVPVLRNCEKLSFADIEKQIVDFGERAKAGKLSLEDMTGGTFTISNGGVYGSLMGTPIVNPPQSAILGMHAINQRPVVVKDNIVIRPMMYLALTYDHRLIDGREAVTFLRKIKSVVEDPRRLLLSL